jgi:multimeric flavodoxin WrbA
MKIALINASPKANKSNTGLLLNELARHIRVGNIIHRHRLRRKNFSTKTLYEIARNDAIVLGFPLYIDALPSRLIAMLITLENHLKAAYRSDIFVYAVINNGFYEGQQTQLAFRIVQNWCERANVRFGGGIGQGGGDVFGVMKNTPLKGWFFRKTSRALASLVRNIEERTFAGMTYLTPAFPRSLFGFFARHFYWHPLARKNNLSDHDLLKRATAGNST